jgi:hypothetical protein
VALAVVAVVVLSLGLRLYWGFAGDDTYIHLTYARNLAAGNGFSFNPGEPSYGSTAPLWTLIVAGVSRGTGIDVYLAAKVLSVLAALLSVLAFRALAQVVTRSYRVSGLAAITFAVDPWLWKWGGSGMETSLAVLLALLAARMHLHRRTHGALPASAFILGIGTLVRPEMIGLFLVALADRALVARRPVGEVLFALFLYLVPVLPWLLYALATFGDVVPTTVHAKSGHMAFAEVASRTVKILGSSYAPSILALIVGLVAAVAHDRDRSLRDRRRPLHAALARHRRGRGARLDGDVQRGGPVHGRLPPHPLLTGRRRSAHRGGRVAAGPHTGDGARRRA